MMLHDEHTYLQLPGVLFSKAEQRSISCAGASCGVAAIKILGDDTWLNIRILTRL
jgi:hypothetical protein